MSIDVEIRGQVAHVTINRPERRNAIDPAAAAALESAWRDIEADRDIRCAVLTGAGDRAFCAGADMKSGGPEGLAYWARQGAGGFGGVALREDYRVPVIARVNGAALGGGFEMVLGCDIVIACDAAKFGFPEPRVGRLPAGGGVTLLPRMMPRKPAMGLLLTGRSLSAAEAAAHGLVNEVVPRAELDAAVDRWVAEILACAPLSLAAIKQVVARTAHMPAADAHRMAVPALTEALESEDAREGVAAFVEKRRPEWKGQ